MLLLRDAALIRIFALMCEAYSVASTAYEKVNTRDTDENLFRVVPVLGHGARVLPLELVPMPLYGAQIRELKQLRRRRQRKRHSKI